MSEPAGAAPPAGRRLQMQYAGGLVKHLGLSMYRGAVPVIAELVANAWDAEATRVEISVPLDKPLKGEQIVLVDDGHGMSWEDVQNAYLVVGRDRRKATGEKSRNGLRTVMGRKGLGKLAGFGIARIVEVRTVREGWLCHFEMDFGAMTGGGQGALVEAYEPRVLTDEAVDEPNGTKVVLRDLSIGKSIPKAGFMESLARRFSILQKGFRVTINGEELTGFAVDTQFRVPDEGLTHEEVDGVGTVSWWVGFTEKPIATEALRGISVLVRDKMAQAPFFFDLSGGTHGQVGMQYMVGEVHADQLDQAEDFISTDRQGILWQEPMPAALRKWGEAKVRELLNEWARLRKEANEEELVRKITGQGVSVDERLARLRPSEQKEARQVIGKLATIESVTDDPDRASELVDLILRAFEDSSFFALLRELGRIDQAERAEVLRLVTELDVFETVRMAEIVRARVQVIQKFREMVEADVPEKPDMQDFLFEHPWLIDPEWLVVEHEKGLEKLLVDHYDLDPAADPSSDRRVDFFCVSTRGRFLVVEVKRPSKTIGKEEVVQIIDYVTYLRQQHPGDPGQPRHYAGMLVGHHLSVDGLRFRNSAAKDDIEVRSWGELLDVAERLHREFLDAVKQRAPDDVRVHAEETRNGHG